MHTKEAYEELINSSPIFYLNPEEDSLRYETEKNLLIKNMYLYLTEESSRYADYSVEIVETLSDCLRYYRKDSGPFTHYFNTAFASRLRKASAENQLNVQSSGIHFSRHEKELSGLIYNYLKKHPEKDLDEMLGVLDEYAEEMGLARKDLEDAIMIYMHSISESGDSPLTDDEGSMTLFDTVGGSGDFTEELDQREAIMTMISRCDSEFALSRKSSREILSMKLTSLFTSWDSEEKYLDIIKECEFYHAKTYDFVYQAGREMKNREISRLTGKSEVNITQIWKRFVEKLKE